LLVEALCGGQDLVGRWEVFELVGEHVQLEEHIVVGDDVLDDVSKPNSRAAICDPLDYFGGWRWIGG